MSTLTKIVAIVLGTDPKRYFMQDKDSGQNFVVPCSSVHRNVVFPKCYLDDSGRLKSGEEIYMVRKDGDAVQTMYYPDNTVYKKNDSGQTGTASINNFKIYNIMQDYTASYSETGFWKKLGKYAKKAGRELVRNVLILWYAFPEASASDKAVIIGALGYFICPIDLIPDVTPVIGYTDDASVVAAAVLKVRVSASDEVIQKAEDKLSEWFD